MPVQIYNTTDVPAGPFYGISCFEHRPSGMRVVLGWRSNVRADNGRLNVYGEVYSQMYLDVIEPDHYVKGAWWEGEWYIRVNEGPWVFMVVGAIGSATIRRMRSGIWEAWFSTAVGAFPSGSVPGAMSMKWWCRALKGDGTGTWEKV